MPQRKPIRGVGAADSIDLPKERRVGQSSPSQVRPVDPSPAGDHVINRGGRVPLVVQMAMPHRLIVLTRVFRSDGQSELGSQSGVEQAATADGLRGRDPAVRADLIRKCESEVLFRRLVGRMRVSPSGSRSRARRCAAAPPLCFGSHRDSGKLGKARRQPCSLKTLCTALSCASKQSRRQHGAVSATCRGARRMQLKTIPNRVCRLHGFVCGRTRLVRALEEEDQRDRLHKVRPGAGGRAPCSGCGQRAPGSSGCWPARPSACTSCRT